MRCSRKLPGFGRTKGTYRFTLLTRDLGWSD
jgi:hypothetical protein